MALSARERELTDEIERRRDELVELATELIGFDTTARRPEDPPRDEARLQELLSDRLGAAGAEIDLFEPDADALAGKPLTEPGLTFEGRPQLIARFRGAGGGKSLLLNGHIDAVSYEPLADWTTHPLRAEVRDGRLYGRGSCDMKGGVAAMSFAAEVLAAQGVTLAGDLVVATNTDEESSGAGALALVEHGLSADAGIVTEPTAFEVWVACRGSAYADVTVPGRAGHAELAQPDWRDGGAVNAIEKASVVLDSIRGLREEWRGRPDFRHPYLAPPDVVPTMIQAGEWSVTYPSACRLTFGAYYLPQQADEGGWGGDVEREITDRIVRDAAADPWLAEHPPTFDWGTACMSMEIPPEEEIVGLALEAGADVGRPTKLGGLDSWYDGATFTLLAGTPSIALGPGPLDAAHTIDEYVLVDDLVACAQSLAVVALRYCKEVPA